MTDADLDQLVAHLTGRGNPAAQLRALSKNELCANYPLAILVLNCAANDIDSASGAIAALRARSVEDAKWIQAMTNAGIKTQMELDAAQSALAERDRDAERLDWLDKQPVACVNAEGENVWLTGLCGPEQTIRAAIDAARDKGKPI